MAGGGKTFKRTIDIRLRRRSFSAAMCRTMYCCRDSLSWWRLSARSNSSPVIAENAETNPFSVGVVDTESGRDTANGLSLSITSSSSAKGTEIGATLTSSKSPCDS